jgi:hypothetical protein
VPIPRTPADIIRILTRFNAVPVASGVRAHRRRELSARNAGPLVNVQVMKS